MNASLQSITNTRNSLGLTQSNKRLLTADGSLYVQITHLITSLLLMTLTQALNYSHRGAVSVNILVYLR